MTQFKALVLNEISNEVVCQRQSLTIDNLSEGEVLIRVAYSSLNYKDMLAFQKNGGIIRKYPLIPGIDLSGTVISSCAERFKVGQEVLVTGFNLGITHSGGLSEVARVPAEWIVPLPERMSLRDAMVIGTAGFTAALSVLALEKGGMSALEAPKILVTGASGGVGSIAVKLLSSLGYSNITGLIRKPYQEEWVRYLGASQVVYANTLEMSSKVLEKQEYHFVLDTVGGQLLNYLIPRLYYGATMTLCGNAGGLKFETTVLPFILRAVKLIGIDSVQYPIMERSAIWEKFTQNWQEVTEIPINEIKLNDVVKTIEQLKQGNHLGRTIVKIQD